MTYSLTRSRLFYPTIALLASILLLAFSLEIWRGVIHPLTGDRPATCLPDRCFCEAIRPIGIAQPVNTWSCVAFLWLGVLTLMDARRLTKERPRNALGTQPLNAVVFGVTTIIIGIGSAFFHTSLTFMGQFLDVLGMYLLASFLVLYGVERLHPLKSTTIVFLYFSANAILATVLWTAPTARRYVFAGLIIVVILIEIAARRRAERAQPSYFFAAIATLGFGFVIWILDISHILCSPHSWLQGHAVWHLSGAIAAGLIYKHFRTECSA
jgi:hypothetical protein